MTNVDVDGGRRRKIEVRQNVRLSDMLAGYYQHNTSMMTIWFYRQTSCSKAVISQVIPSKYHVVLVERKGRLRGGSRREE